MKNDVFITELPEVLNKDEVLEESRSIRKELHDSTLPVLKNAASAFNVELKHGEVINLQDVYTKISGNNTNFIEATLNNITQFYSNLEDLESYIVSNVGNEIVKSSISLKEINILQFIGIAGFISRYARYVVSYFYAAESSTYPGSSINLDESFSKADMKYIKDNFLDFVKATQALSTKLPIGKLLDTVVDVHVNPSNVRTIGSTQQQKKVDPLNLQYLNVTNNFIYRLMLKRAERQADKYKLALEEKRLLEHRHLLLKRQRDGKQDPYLEKEIVITENRISKLEYKLRKWEEQNA